MMEDREKYGASVERGVIRMDESGNIRLVSTDRGGIRSPALDGIPDAYDGELVHMTIFPDGDSAVLANERITDEEITQIADAEPTGKMAGKYLDKIGVRKIFTLMSGIIKRVCLDTFYPVGIVVSFAENINPATQFGGTWEQLHGRFLYASDDGHALGTNGGSETVTLSKSQMPAHNHNERELVGTVAAQNLSVRYNGANATLWGSASGIVSTDGNAGIAHHYSSSTQITNYTGNDKIKITATHTHDSEGGGQAHDNMPPYLVCNIWKRTA